MFSKWGMEAACGQSAAFDVFLSYTICFGRTSVVDQKKKNLCRISGRYSFMFTINSSQSRISLANLSLRIPDSLSGAITQEI